MEIKLDKLEKDMLLSLKEKTGKSEEDIIKLAIYEFNRRMSEDKTQNVQEVQPQQPITIPLPYPVYPEPQNPAPTYPYPWDTTPYYPYPMMPYIICSSTIYDNINASGISFTDYFITN